MPSDECLASEGWMALPVCVLARALAPQLVSASASLTLSPKLVTSFWQSGWGLHVPAQVPACHCRH